MNKSPLFMASAALLVGAAALSFAPDADRAPPGFGDDVRPLDVAEMEASKGGVGVTVISPAASTDHYVDNPQLEADVFNYQDQTWTTLHLYHGPTKTGSRLVNTPLPTRTGTLLSRFRLTKGTKDLTLRYTDANTGHTMVAGGVDAQRLHPDVVLRKVIVHNLTTPSVSTNVSYSTVARVVDSRNYNQPLGSVTSMDTILAQCDEDERVQFTLNGNDSDGTLHRIVLPDDSCSNLDLEITPNGNKKPWITQTASTCFTNLFNERMAQDPMMEAYHVYIVDALHPQINGLSNKVVQGAVIPENEFNISSNWLARLMLHEIGHGFGFEHPGAGACSGDQDDRNFMCSGNTMGSQITSAQCAEFRTGNAWMKDFND